MCVYVYLSVYKHVTIRVFSYLHLYRNSLYSFYLSAFNLPLYSHLSNYYYSLLLLFFLLLALFPPSYIQILHFLPPFLIPSLTQIPYIYINILIIYMYIHINRCKCTCFVDCPLYCHLSRSEQ